MYRKKYFNVITHELLSRDTRRWSSNSSENVTLLTNIRQPHLAVGIVLHVGNNTLFVNIGFGTVVQRNHAHVLLNQDFHRSLWGSAGIE